ncbi:MAG: UDP-N-acetylmuramoyl-L-alanine--D-glutamate ligase [Planctomycetes bacterium]|nr:UDP-N-acetylmuramoyl-L-alanine--D-glutamate ligase [Planctomycetota bacterium]
MTQGALAGRRAVVMGLGLFGGGVASARFLARRGALVTVTDLRDADQLAPAVRELDGLDVRFVLGRHDAADFDQAELLVVNPAVPPHVPLIERAREHGARVTSEVGLFLDHVAGTVAAVTGTQGKSSTCRFLADLLAGCGERVRLGGNIGKPLLAEVDEIEPDELVVLELSSYQLQTLPDDVTRSRRESPLRIALFTNVLSDHLERHGTRADYAAAKLRLLELLPEGATVVWPANADWLPERDALPAGLRTLPFHANSAAPAGEDALQFGAGSYRRGTLDLAPLDATPPLPAFQRENLLAALGAANALGCAPRELAKALPALRGLPHRLADLGTVRGRRVWDNAVSTTPDSTVSALRALGTGTTALIGGKVKDLDTSELLEVTARHAARAILFGQAAELWLDRFRAAGIETHAAPDVRTAVTAAFELTREGDAILFSPACSSFDAYPNFKARADDFHACLKYGTAFDPSV